MSELQRKRSGFQFRLLTALTVTIVVGGVIGLNLSPTDEYVTLGSDGGLITSERALALDQIEQPLNNWVRCVRHRRLGWPLVIFRYTDVVRPVPDGWHQDGHYGTLDVLKKAFAPMHRGDELCKRGLLVDLAILVALVIGTALLSEFFIRRREIDIVVPSESPSARVIFS